MFLENFCPMCILKSSTSYINCIILKNNVLFSRNLISLWFCLNLLERQFKVFLFFFRSDKPNGDWSRLITHPFRTPVWFVDKTLVYICSRWDNTICYIECINGTIFVDFKILGSSFLFKFYLNKKHLLCKKLTMIYFVHFFQLI